MKLLIYFFYFDNRNFFWFKIMIYGVLYFMNFIIFFKLKMCDLTICMNSRISSTSSIYSNIFLS